MSHQVQGIIPIPAFHELAASDEVDKDPPHCHRLTARGDFEKLEELYNQWVEHKKKKKSGLPDYMTWDTYLIPLTLMLVKSGERIEKLTRVLISLTIVLAFLTGFLIIFEFLSLII